MEGEHLPVTHRVERTMTRRCPKGSEKMTHLTKSESETRKPGTGSLRGSSCLLSVAVVAVISVMTKSNSEGKGFIWAHR